MSVKDDGGPAFPGNIAVSAVGDVHEGVPGMTLRDWFAGQVVSGAMSGSWGEYALARLNESKTGSAHTLSQFAYQLADAMLAARTGEKE